MLGALKVLIIAAAFVASGCAARGPQSFGSVSGRVVDDHGTPLPGATVTLGSDGGRAIQVSATSRDGEYAFRNLPAARYRLTIRLAGFASPVPLFVTVDRGADQRLDVAALKPDATAAPLNADALRGAQVAVIRELMKLARKSPAYYAVAVVDGTDYRSPSTSLLEAVTHLAPVPVKPWSGYRDAQELQTFSSRDAVQVVVMVRPDAQATSLLFLKGAVTEYGRTWEFRFQLALQRGIWTVTDMVKIATFESAH